MAKRIAVLSGAAAFVIIAGFLAIWLYIGRAGSSDLENWIGRQVVGILQNHLTPKVSFGSLDYQAPRTVVIDDLMFTAGKRPILHVARARLELAEIPRRGQPIRIQDVALDAPRLQFVIQKTGGLVGWSNFVKTEAVKHPETVPPGQRLSDVLVLRHVQIQDGEVIYQDEANAANPMTLPGINLRLETPPVENAPGWYQLIGQLSRDPLLDLRLNGRINLDTGLLDIAALQLAASLDEQQYGTLPPALQDFLRQHEIQGALTASGKGQLPLNDPSRFAGTVRAQLRDARFRHENTTVPIQDVTLDARLPDGGIEVKATGVNLAAEHRAGEPLPFFSVKSVAARLAGIPAKGQPLVIERVQVDQPHVVFAARPQGGLTGWSQLAPATPRTPTASRPAAESNVTDVLQAVQLRKFGISGGAVTYRPLSGQPLTLDGIDVALTGEPRENSPDILDVNGTIQAGPLVKADLQGQLDTRTAVLKIDQFESATEVGPNNYELLPPQAHEWMAQYKLQAKVAINAHGTIPLAEQAEPKIDGTVELTSADAQFNGVSVPLGQARVQFSFPERRIQASIADLKLIRDGSPLLSVPKLAASVAFPPDAPVEVQTELDAGYTGPQMRAPLVVQGLNATLQMRHGEQAKGLQFSGQVQRPDVLSIDFEGNYDQSVLTFRKLLAKADLTEATISSLPPAMQDSIRRNQVQGIVVANGQATVPLGDASRLAGHFELTATGTRLPYANAMVSADKLQIKGDLPNGPMVANANGMALKAGDLQFFSAAGLDLRIRQLPGNQRPMKIDLLGLQQPQVVLRSQQKGFAGWSGLIQEERTANQGPPPILDQLRVQNGELVYSAGGGENMTLPGINITADLEPGGQNTLYRVTSQIRQGRFLNMDLEGRLNLTDQLLQLKAMSLRAELTGQENNLPPSVQQFVTEHQLRGVFSIEAQGRIPLKDPAQLQGRLSATARNASFSYGQTQWPVQQLDLTAQADQGVISSGLGASMLDGRVQANGQLSLPQQGSFQVDWQVTNVQLEKMLRAVESGEPESKYAGILTGKGQIRGRLTDLPQSLSGPGELTVEKGRLINLPLIRNIAVNLITAPLGLNVNRTDRGNVTWQFRHQGLQIQNLAVNSPLIALEGSGTLSYAGQVDMKFTAQPVQDAAKLARKLPGPLGQIGGIIGDVGKLGSEIVAYRVTGDISNPKVTPAPLGFTGK